MNQQPMSQDEKYMAYILGTVLTIFGVAILALGVFGAYASVTYDYVSPMLGPASLLVMLIGVIVNYVAVTLLREARQRPTRP